jgi:predicted AAA+ superfamily ATPase
MAIDVRFLPHNQHLEFPAAFPDRDPHLRQLSRQGLVYRFPLLDHLPVGEPGIYSITGGRQIGKTTVLKQWMADLLGQGIDPQAVVYLTGELIDDHHALVRLVSDCAAGRSGEGVWYLLLDEITYVREWDRGIKFLADAGLLETAVVVLTGSDSVLIREARMRLPGRRGRRALVDFHLFPLTFRECVRLRRILTADEIARADEEKPSPEIVDRLLSAFEEYLLHGGYLTALNDWEEKQSIAPATFATYSDWIRGDVLKRGKREHSLRELLGAVFVRYGTQVTWNVLGKDLSIDHPATVADYLRLLARMDVVIIQPALREDKLAAAPKTARKILLADPFIFHALRAWLEPGPDPFETQVRTILADPGWTGRLAEACAVSHYHRFYPTYYIKGEGEVDIAYVHRGRFWPVEVKWTGQLRTKELKQILKYPNSIICARHPAVERIHGVRTEPLPLTLLRLGCSPLS